MLKVDSIDVFYGEQQILWNVSCDVANRELVAIVGSNGAGKTTLLKTIVGFLHPRKGSIWFKGERIDLLPTHKIVEKGLTLVPEGRQLFPKLTVLENLLMGSFSPRSREQRRALLEQVFLLFPQLKIRQNQLAKTLSGGESQMLAIGRALMSKPTLLLLDEPSLGLAPNVVQSLFSTIRGLNEQGLTVLIVEQHVHKALEMSSRGYVLENGAIVLEGPAQQLLEDKDLKRAYLGL